jgi:RNA polymerase sigma-70 factor (ECF subfamily)
VKTESDDSLDDEVAAWIESARLGSAEALGTLLQTFRQYLAIIAEHGLKGDLQAKVDRSDVVQETFLEAHRDFASFRGQGREQFEAWLRRLLLNNLLNERRKYRDTQKRDSRSELALDRCDTQQQIELVSADTSPTQRAVRNEEATRLELAMSTLPEHYREIIRLRNHEGLSFVVIGRRLNRSPDSARMLWSRAFESLADALDPPQ